MADRCRERVGRPTVQRPPLAELRNKTNTPPISQRPCPTSKHIKTRSSNPSLPHNESLEPNGTLAVRTSDASCSPAHKRVSQMTNDERDSKRNSAISTASTASGRRRKTFIGHWQLGKTIGKGGCSRVRIVRHRYREQYGAVKIITRSTAEKTRAQSLANLIESTRGNAAITSSGYRPIPYGLEREIAVMKLLEHPNIVRLYDVWENRNELYLIMEYVDGGELFHYVDDRKGLIEHDAVYIFRQIISALLYCHRLRICHRDLKPENILLDQRNLCVKLIDFGMAALQPEGRLLSTPCGSPHYAAPEVVKSKPYDGTQADVWSCGVILYVMLTGTTPYNYGEDADIGMLFRDISRAKYYMPADLSTEAKDLIKRIFVPDPKKRLTMDEVWDHPLLQKYNKQFGFDGPNATKEAAVGNLPQLDQWKVKRIQDVDREILGNMRTLWHSESEQSLMKKLLNNDYNQEKLFYAALVKHREENLENYIGEADDISYSASDYHHSQTISAAEAPPMPSVAARSQSQYSIMNNEHLRPSTSFVGPAPSISSYDPYRASKDPIVDGRGEYVNVIVHRNGSNSTRRTSAADRRLRHPHSTRIETLKQQMSRRSNPSSSSLRRSSSSRPSMPRSSTSRHSMAGSLLPSSPPMIATMRPSDVHKRGVSFSHIRRISTTSALTSEQSTKGSMPATPCLPRELRERQQKLQAQRRETQNSSPAVPVQQPIRSRKERHGKQETPHIKVRKTETTPSQHIKSEIRKHSAELEKACEEAFFRDSFGSAVTARTSLTDKPSPYDTPPSSVSAALSVTPELPAMRLAPRPLPELPKDTPNTYLARTLEDTRKKLEAYKSSGDDNTAKFDEVMKMLENIMPAGSCNSHKDRRIRTAPEASKISDQIDFLPIISEESSDVRSSRDGANWHRSVTDPVAKAKMPEDKTIRMVQPSSSGTIAPLNVRKRSEWSQANSNGVDQRLNSKSSMGTLSGKQSVINKSALPSINEDSTLASPTVLRKKRSGWFGRTKKEVEELAKTELKNGPATLSRLDDREERRKSQILSPVTPKSKPLPEDPPLSADSSEFPIRKRRFGAAKKGFSKWIGRISKDKSADNTMVEEDTTMFTHPSSDSLFSSQSPAGSSNDALPAAGPERSWFARFFNIKPAVHILCFSIPRGRARQELVILFKEWQRHGIRDLQYSRVNNTIMARVDKHNSLDIRPVTLRIELFIVLEQGRKVGLSIARFVQVKGAVSGFRKVVEVTDSVMRGREWLVQDEEKWRALCEVVSES